MTDPRLDLLLTLADDELVIGHRHSHWTGVAPHLEEDLAFSSISQDEIGHAVVWYGLASELCGKDPDTLALGRQPHEYRNAILVERPARDWAYTIARHYLYDTADGVRLQALAGSSWKPIVEATGAILREERYHLDHARAWLQRLGSGPIDARRAIAEGLADAFSEALGLFEPLPGEQELVAEGVLGVPHSELLQQWLDVVADDLTVVGLERVFEQGAPSPPDTEFVPTSSGEMDRDEARPSLSAPHLERDGERWVPAGEFSGEGGRHGRHSEDFTELWDEMTSAYRAHPGARW